MIRVRVRPSVSRTCAAWLLFGCLAAGCDGSASDSSNAPDASDSSPSIATRVETLLEQCAALERFHGVALVAEGDRVLVRRGFGQANRELGVAAAPDHRFLIGSMTKAFTAALVVGLAEEGVVDLDAPVTAYWPEFEDPSDGRITLRHLLTHRSGLPHWGARSSFLTGDALRPWRPEEVIGHYVGAGLEFDPGDDQSYSSIGYLVAAVAIERAAGQSYRSLLQERLFAPLRLTSTSLDDASTVESGRAAAYRFNFLRARYDNAERRDPGTTFSTGGILTTVDDLLAWSRAIRGVRGGLSGAVRRQLLEDDPVGGAYGWRHGLGGDDSNPRVVWHGGQVGGYRSQITIDLDSGRTVVLLGNLRDIRTGDITQAIWQTLDGEEVPAPRRSTMKEVLRITAEDGAEAAARRFDEILASESEAYDTDPMELLLAAVELRSDDACDRAAILYEHWIDTYPEHRLGEAALRHATDCRLRNGDVTDARRHVDRLAATAGEDDPGVVALRERLAAVP